MIKYIEKLKENEREREMLAKHMYCNLKIYTFSKHIFHFLLFIIFFCTNVEGTENAKKKTKCNYSLFTSLTKIYFHGSLNSIQLFG